MILNRINIKNVVFAMILDIIMNIMITKVIIKVMIIVMGRSSQLYSPPSS